MYRSALCRKGNLLLEGYLFYFIFFCEQKVLDKFIIISYDMTNGQIRTVLLK